LDYEVIGSSSSTQFNILNGQHSKGFYLVTQTWNAVGGTFTTNITPGVFGGASFVSGFCEIGLTSARAFTGGHAMCQALVKMSDETGALTLAPPAGIGANDVVDITVAFMGYVNGFTSDPTISQKRSRRKPAEEKVIEANVLSALASNPAIIAQLKKMIMGDDKLGFVHVSEPGTPDTAAAAGGKPLPPSLNLGTASKDEKSDVPSKKKAK